MAVGEAGRTAGKVLEGLPLLDPGRFVQELRCSCCGYGIVVQRQPPPCPMCGEEAWEQPSWLPYRRRNTGI
jgi:rubrerythrin